MIMEGVTPSKHSHKLCVTTVRARQAHDDFKVRLPTALPL